MRKLLLIVLLVCFLLGMATREEAENAVEGTTTTELEKTAANDENQGVVPLEKWERNKRVDQEVYKIADELEEICEKNNNSYEAIGWSMSAARLVGELKELGKDALPAIYDVTKDTSRNVNLRRVMMSELGFSKEQAVIRPLIDFLLNKSEDASLRYNAADLLGRILKDTTATTAMIKTMEDKNNPSEIRAKAASAFVSIHDKKAIPNLLMLLSDSSKDVRAMAAWSIGSNAYFFKDTKVTVPLIEALSREKTDVVRIKIIGALSVTDDKRAVTTLSNLIKSRGSNYNYAIKCISNLKYPESIEVLKELLKDDNERIRFDAAKALLKMGDKSVASDIEKVLPTLENYHRNMISDSLQKFKER